MSVYVIVPRLVVSSVLDKVPQKNFFRSSCQFMALCCNWFGSLELAFSVWHCVHTDVFLYIWLSVNGIMPSLVTFVRSCCQPLLVVSIKSGCQLMVV